MNSPENKGCVLFGISLWLYLILILNHTEFLSFKFLLFVYQPYGCIDQYKKKLSFPRTIKFNYVIYWLIQEFNWGIYVTTPRIPPKRGGGGTQKWLLRLVAGFLFENFHYWMLNPRSVIFCHMKVATSITRPYVPYTPMYN